SRMLALERGRVEQAQRDIAGLREELRATLEQRERLERERDTLQTRIGTLEREKSTIEGQKAEAERRILVLDKEKADLLARIAGLDREKLEALARIVGLERQGAEEKRAAEAERARAAGEKTELEQRLEALEARRRREQDAARKLAAEKQSVEQRLAALERELEAVRRERDRLQAALLVEGKAVGDQKRLTDEQAAEIALLNRQMAALRQQLAAIE